MPDALNPSGVSVAADAGGIRSRLRARCNDTDRVVAGSQEGFGLLRAAMHFEYEVMNHVAISIAGRGST